MLKAFAEAGIAINKLSVDPFRSLLEQKRFTLGDTSRIGDLIPVLSMIELNRLKADCQGYFMMINFNQREPNKLRLL